MDHNTSRALSSVPEPPDSVTERHASRPVPATLADLIREVDSWVDWRSDKRRQIITQIRQCVGIAGRSAGIDRPEPAKIPCSVPWLNDHLFNGTPAMFGLEAGTVSNAVSGLRRALMRTGLTDPYHTPPLPIESPWRLLQDSLDDSPLSLTLKRFTWWGDQAGIGPFAIRQAAVPAFEGYVRSRLLHSVIPKLVCTTVRAWNRAAATVPGWPQIILKSPHRREPYTFEFSAYPETLQAELAHFARRLARKDGHGPFRGDGPKRALRASSIKARLFSLRQALAALVRLGRDSMSITSLGTLVEVENVKAILMFYWERALNLRLARGEFADGSEPPNEAGVTSQTAAIGSALLMVAKYHCKLKPSVIARLSRLVADLRPPRQSSITAKNCHRLDALSVELNRANLLLLPQKLMNLGEEILRYGPVKPSAMQKAARLSMTAVATEILLCCPLRIRNLTRLKLGVQLIRSDPQTGLITLIRIPPHEVKNDVAIEWLVGSETAALIDRYLERFRPLLRPSPASPWLFPGNDGRDAPRAISTMSRCITDAIAEHVGVIVNPHLFRAFVGCLVLEADPGALEDLRLLLGHKTLATALAYYAYVNRKVVARRVDGVLRNARNKGEIALASGKLGRRTVDR